MKYLVALLFILSNIGCTMLVPKEDHNVITRSPYKLSVETPTVAGLENLNLDLWTEGIHNGVMVNELIAPPKIFIVSSLQKKFSEGKADWLRRFYEDIAGQYAKAYMNEALYLQLAEGLEEARIEIRKMRYRGMRSAMKLLDVLMQETLYVRSIKFPIQSSWVTFGNASAIKGDLVTYNAHSFAAQFKNRLCDVPEEVSKIDVIMSSKVTPNQSDRLYVYRYRGLNTKRNQIAFNKLGKLSDKNVDARQIASIFKESTIVESDSPFPKIYWSQWGLADSEFSRWLGAASASVPRPGDVEMNSTYEVVSKKIRVSAIENNRIKNAVIDVFVSELTKNNEFVSEYLVGQGRSEKEQSKRVNQFFDYIENKVVAEIGAMVLTATSQDRVIGLNTLRSMVHKNMPRYLDHLISNAM